MSVCPAATLTRGLFSARRGKRASVAMETGTGKMEAAQEDLMQALQHAWRRWSRRDAARVLAGAHSHITKWCWIAGKAEDGTRARWCGRWASTTVLAMQQSSSPGRFTPQLWGRRCQSRYCGTTARLLLRGGLSRSSSRLGAGCDYTAQMRCDGPRWSGGRQRSVPQ